MVKLRPHHLLCIQNYVGKGYNDEFISNMNTIIEKIKEENKVEIIFSLDNICWKCPNKNNDECVTNDKVIEIDKKIVQCFGIEEKDYIYLELVEEIKEKLTEEKKKYICGSCEWYMKKVCFNKE